MIKVLFFARLREQIGCDSISIEPTGIATTTDVREKIIQQYPLWTEYLSDKKLLVAVNHTLTKIEHPVVNGDEVAFFPPVTGG